MAAVSDAEPSEDPMEIDDCKAKKHITHEKFTEIQEVRDLIDSLKNVWSDLRASEMAYERFKYIVNEYQQQPHLIDPYLEEILMKLLTIVRDTTSPKGLLQEAFSFMYLVTKMRGFKVVMRLLPHEVVDMEPVLLLIDQQDPYDVQCWETRYMLLLWLTVLCMIPFDLHRLDSNQPLGDNSNAGKAPVMERILRIGQLYMMVNDKCLDAASYLLSRFLIRPDVKIDMLPRVIDWNLKLLSTLKVDTMAEMGRAKGALTMLALLFKYGKREDLLPFAPIVLKSVMKCNFMESNNTHLRKATTKLIQRLGLNFLKNRVAKWRYQRGSRSLSENLREGAASNLAAAVSSELKQDQQEEEDFDIAEETEEVIGFLLGCLKDKDNIVRWSAAKGVGRVTGRLPKELANEVVGSVLELFSYQESEGAWHGGCLTLAELGRRGLLLPERLDDVVPIVLKALLYDERKGSYSVGIHVRDAACYVCWAFARAYDPKEIAPYVTKIANALVIVSIFDREVNVRRAAAAAFQENVGRQGTFPHGIDILTTVDYFAVGIRSHCYLDLSLFIAQFEVYTIPLIDHLVNVKVRHWDNAIRIETSKALHKLTVTAPEYVADKVLPTLLSMTSTVDLFQRHGAIIASAEVTHALFLHHQANKRPIESVLSSEVVEDLKNIASSVHKSALFKGHGGDFMRKAVCLLIKKLSLSRMPFHSQPIIDLWQGLIMDCLSSIVTEVQAAAVSAIPAFFTEYYTQKDGSADPDKQEEVLSHYLSQLNSPIEITRMGYSLALGAMPVFMLQGHMEKVLSGLIACSRYSKEEEKMAEARRNAIKAISCICKTVSMKRDGDPQCCICQSNLLIIYRTLIAALGDYAMDSRGDIGSWVREASMTALAELTERVVLVDPELLPPDIVHEMVCGLIQQACEKIDRTRALAGETLFNLLYFQPPVPGIQERDILTESMPQHLFQNLNWTLPVETFPCFAKLLSVPAYTRFVLLGMIISVGGLTESLVKYSSQSLLNHMKKLREDGLALKAFTEHLLSIFEEYQKNDRVTIPLLKTLDLLLGYQCFDGLPEEYLESFTTELLNRVKMEVYLSADPHKIMGVTDVYCGMLQFSPSVRSKSLAQLVVFLCHRYPRVRKTTGDKLYEAVLTYGEIVAPEALDEVLTILSETEWDVDDIEQIRSVRNKLCDLLKIARPVRIMPGAVSEGTSMPAS